MSKTQDLRALARTGEARSASRNFSRLERLEIVAQHFEKLAGLSFSPVPDIERTSPKVWRARSTINTVFQPVVEALSGAGIPVESTIGAVQDELGLTDRRVHDFGCFCMHHAVGVVTAEHAAMFMRLVADENSKQRRPRAA